MLPTTCLALICSRVPSAIETNSDFHMRKLVAYWILFSLISLFEYTFSILLDWVPVWPYVKILAICWLVMPGFNGASIAYNNIVRPCLSMQPPQILVDMVNKKQYVPLTRESFLEEAEKYVKENGTEGLERLFASKQIISEPPVAQKDIKAVDHLDKSTAAAEIEETSGPAKRSRRRKARAEKQQMTTTVDADIKVNNAASPENLTENAFLVPPAFKNVQKEWTCAVCQVTTQSEATLKSHLQGMKHRTKCEELKLVKQTAAKKGVSTSTPNEERNCAISQVTTQSKTTRTSLHQEFIEGKQTEIKNNSSSTTIQSEQPNHVPKKVSADSGINKVSCANQNPKKSSSGSGPNYKFVCDLCQVKLQSEAALKSHLQGTKHKSKSELKANEMTEKDKITSSAKYSDKKSSGLNQNLSSIARVNIEAKVSNGFHSCSICNVTCTSKSGMALHLRGNGHLSVIEDSGYKRGVQYWCNICDVKYSSEVDMACHLYGKKHDSNLNESD
ncbi:uncharacterized protein LOC141668671 isoform X2 [Apium graveolens]|uniref:uncharacterized protein LOC141668671 isoform X2 n=1 Tax=Apium graveolens TaxID=4045 RepID=UPI003D7B1C99